MVALSSYEVEYIAASGACCQAVRLETMLRELQVKLSSRTRLVVDNKSAINLAKHATSHGRSKHIKTWSILYVIKCATENSILNTKNLSCS